MLLQPCDLSRVGQVEGKRLGQSGRLKEQAQHRDLLIECCVSKPYINKVELMRCDAVTSQDGDAPGEHQMRHEQLHPLQYQGRPSTWQATRPRRQARLAPQQSSSLPTYTLSTIQQPVSTMPSVTGQGMVVGVCRRGSVGSGSAMIGAG